MSSKTKRIVAAVLIFAAGFFIGILARWLGTVGADGTAMQHLCRLISQLFFEMPFLVFLGCLIAYFSKSPGKAALNVSAFFAGMLVSSLIYSAVSLAIPSFPQIIRWIILLLCAAMAAYIVWHSVKKGWPAALCTAVPIGYLIASGWRVYATGSIFDMAAIVMAAALYVIIPRSKSQKLRVIPLAALTVFVILRFDLVLWLFKGL